MSTASRVAAFHHGLLGYAEVFDQAPGLAALPGVVHGFTDRNGGVSEGRYATLNLASKWGDDLDAVAQNRARLAAAAGFALPRLRCAKQVHGHDVVEAATVDPDEPPPEADALVCRRDDGLVVGVLTADCVPVLVADEAGTIAAAIHAGWRGVVAEIVERTLAVVTAAGVAPSRLRAAIGPCIEQAAFEVGEEVAQRFAPAFVDRSAARAHVDLVAAVRAQLQRAGVPAASIERVGACTHAHPQRYFSFRRDGAGIGQMLAFIGFVGR